MEQENLQYKVGILGPRSFLTGGHDKGSDLRIKLRYKFNEILSNVNEPYPIVGLTGLGLGVEQDFAYSCYNMDIPYSSYLAYENMETKWFNLSADVEKNFSFLLNNATGILYISSGPYSPKKIEKKNQKVIEDADLLIVVDTPIHKYDNLLKHAKNTPVVKIALWEFPH